MDKCDAIKNCYTKRTINKDCRGALCLVIRCMLCGNIKRTTFMHSVWYKPDCACKMPFGDKSAILCAVCFGSAFDIQKEKILWQHEYLSAYEITATHKLKPVRNAKRANP